MNKTIRIEYVANAGILVIYDGKKILIDGIYGDVPMHFSKMPPEILEDMKAGKGDYKDIDFLLFTHDHIDHMNIPRIFEYCQNQQVGAIIAPKISPRLEVKFGEIYKKCRGLKVEISAPPGEFRRISLGDIQINYYKARHDGPHLAAVEHYIFLIELGSKKILILSDSDFRNPELIDILQDSSPDIVFANLLTFNHKRGRALITDVIKPKKTLIYHIPFEEDDNQGYRKIVSADIRKYAEDFPALEVFMNKGDSIEI